MHSCEMIQHSVRHCMSQSTVLASANPSSVVHLVSKVFSRVAVSVLIEISSPTVSVSILSTSVGLAASHSLLLVIVVVAVVRRLALVPLVEVRLAVPVMCGRLVASLIVIIARIIFLECVFS